MKRRRAVAGLSLLGMASMAAITLRQMGIVTHLPDPPLKGFDSDKVNLSETAFGLGVPDGTIGMVGYAANLPLAAFGGADRAKLQPWAPLATAGKAAVDAVIAARLLYQMPTHEKAWCSYCIVGALVNFAILALVLPEAKDALSAVRST
ncbi:MAG: vitamin K epoxide reductase family protein [Dehalococcoidia bacterium]